jgi:nucleotide-binding universal stress UspA family protein
MFKHLLIPLDGSKMAEAALPAAAFLAEKFASRVTLMHAVERNAPSEVHGQSHLKNAREAYDYLNELAQRAFAKGIAVDCHVHEAEVDNVAGSVVAHADELKHDLVVMCSHGRGKSLHLFLGSIAQRVIGMGSLPVLITHPDQQGGAPPFSCRNILVPLDGDPDHAKALPVAREIALACAAALHLAIVVPRFSSLSGEAKASSRMSPATASRILELQYKDAQEFIKTETDKLRSQGIAVSGHVLRGDPAEMVANAANSSNVDLTVLATHGKTGMKAFWEGSVAHRICSFSRVPLLLIPLIPLAKA